VTSDGRLDGLVLDFGLSFEDLHHRDGLKRLDDCWLECLNVANPELGRRYADARRGPDAIDSRAEAALLIEVSAHVDAFIARLFGIAESFEMLRAAHTRLDPLYRVKWKFVKRQALLGVPAQALVGFDADAARAMLLEAITSGSADHDGSVGDRGQAPSFQIKDFDELAFAQAVLRWQADASTHADRLELARLYSAWAVTTDEGRKRHGHGVLFRHPSHIDPLDLLRHTVRHEDDGVSITTIRPDQIRRRLNHDRAPFALTDAGADLAGALDESHYCLLCHKQGTDSCSTGLRQSSSGEAKAPFRRDAFGNALSGCPLEERISEFHTLKRSGLAISALAMMMIDNPMVAATGHRICNDCMKACIYQAQTPVDIPQAETRTLKDVLELPWGLEIYSLLSRWNPLNLRRPLPAPASGRKVLVVGTGPAGFTLAHHLMNDGHTVVAIDGLKIEPLAQSLSGVDPHGARVAFAPVRDIDSLHEDLDSRTISGFGGVAEYGITVRWDKNFLKIVRLLLERRDQFTLIGGVRFGGTLGVDDAWQLGFDHIALAIGAGKPTTLDIPNGLARGVRTASDFLMALQLTGAAQADSIANMQLRLPAVVIGGGLTAVDTATEALAYYVSQVDKFLARHEALVADIGEAAARAGWRADEHTLADEYIAHAQALRAERDEARSQGRAARLVELLQSWGGVTVAYRRRLIDSPAYTLSHEELNRALEEGLRFAAAHRRRCRFGGALDHLLPPASRRSGSVARRPRHRAAGANRDHRRRHAAQHRACARRRRACRPRWALLPCARRIGPAGRARARQPQTGRRPGADGRQSRRAVDLLFRRCASELLRQCGQGDGIGPSRLSGGLAGAGCAQAAEPRIVGRFFGAFESPFASPRGAHRAARTQHPGSGHSCTNGRRSLHAGAVLSLAEFFVACRPGRTPQRRQHCARDGRPGDDRRLGRQGKGPGLDDRARNGRLVRSVRAAAN
jgi:NADPH-dependent glutamate synthase beta subunit-like oxidoreductase